MCNVLRDTVSEECASNSFVFFLFFFLQLNLVCSSIYLLVQLILNELRASDSAQVLFVALTGNLQGQELQT